MRILHLEPPRDLSFSLKPWRLDLHEAAASRGFFSRQVDLNHSFWQWLLRQAGSSLYSRLLDLEFGNGQSHRDLVGEIGRALRNLTVPKGKIDLGGLRLSTEILHQSKELARWVQNGGLGSVFDHWWESLSDDGELIADWDVVSFAVGSLDELTVASFLSHRIREHRPETHTCLAYHQWENFSLADRIPRLAYEGALLKMFDSAILHREEAGGAIGSLLDALADGAVDGLHNLAFTIDGKTRVLPGEAGPTPEGKLSTGEGLSDYVNSTGLPPGQILYLDSIVRNDCYYGKCTFCVQNVGYRHRQAYRQDPELARTMGLVHHLATFDGVRSFSFVDQAVPPGLLERLAREMSALELDTDWCVRMLAADLDDSLLAEASKSGCREILFGIESASPSTLQSIGKRTEVAGPEPLHKLANRLANHGMDATYSFIRGLPGESPQEFADSTLSFIRDATTRHRNLSIILNPFSLFSGSRIELEPSRHGIREVMRSDTDLELELNFRTDHWPMEERGIPTELACLAAGLPGDERSEPAVDAARLHYSSIGLLHRWRTGRWLVSDVGKARGKEAYSLYPDRSDVILGASGYLGYNLANRLTPEHLVLSSTSRPCAVTIPAAPYLEHDLRRGAGTLFGIAPHTAWIAARPVGDPFRETAAFYAGLQCLINDWVQHGRLRRVVFFSSQLVMRTPRPYERASGSWPTEPECEYGCHLAQMELFLSALSRKRALSVDIIRLPLLWGGCMLEPHRSEQMLSSWHHALVNGRRWEIRTEEEREFGNSWVDVEDLIDALREDRGPGLRIQTATSGDFRYDELQQAFGPARDLRPLHLHRTCFFLDDELGLPRRELDFQDPGTVAPTSAAAGSVSRK